MVEISLVKIDYIRFGGAMIDKNRTIRSFLRFLKVLAMTGDMPSFEIYFKCGHRVNLNVTASEARSLRIVDPHDDEPTSS